LKPYQVHPEQIPDRGVLPSADDAITDAGSTGADHADMGRGGLGEIENTAANERATIVDADDDCLAVTLVGDGDLGAELEIAMSGRQIAGIHPLARRGARRQRIPGCTAAIAGPCLAWLSLTRCCLARRDRRECCPQGKHRCQSSGRYFHLDQTDDPYA